MIFSVSGVRGINEMKNAGSSSSVREKKITKTERTVKSEGDNKNRYAWSVYLSVMTNNLSVCQVQSARHC